MTDRRIRTLSELEVGDHIKMPCRIFDIPKKTVLPTTHHALVVKVLNDHQLRVIHNNGEKVKEEVQTLRPCDVTLIAVVVYEQSYSGQDAIDRAQEKLGTPYSLLAYNSEHFATWVRCGREESKQVEKGLAGAKGGLAGGAIAGAAAGSFVAPIVGTVIGAVAGGAIGIFGGLFFSTGENN